MKPKIVLGLSGGVDSAVAAGILSKDYDVHCVFLDIGLGGQAAADAEEVAAKLGLSFESVDIRGALEHNVCAPFAAAYLSGRTPLPCAVCNPTVKFPSLFAVAERVGAVGVATGHYARVENGLLKKGLPANDQSYMLARLPKKLLEKIHFPLGNFEKRQIRLLAGEEALPVAEKPDSMEICFIPDGDYAHWLDGRGPTPPPGDFVDAQGNVLGRHEGIHHYTLGQGRGLGVSGPHRYFVTAIEPDTNRVVLSDGSDLLTRRVSCTDPNWIAIHTLDGPMEVTVRLRHSKTETPATISPTGGDVLVETHDAVRAPTPGQLAVFYDGDTVVGSAWII